MGAARPALMKLQMRLRAPKGKLNLSNATIWLARVAVNAVRPARGAFDLQRRLSFPARQPLFIRNRSVNCFNGVLQISKSVAHFGVASFIGLSQGPGDIATSLHMVLSRFDQLLNMRIFFDHFPAPAWVLAPSILAGPFLVLRGGFFILRR